MNSISHDARRMHSDATAWYHPTAIIAAGWLFYMLLCGGVSIPNPTHFAIQSATSLIVIGIAAWRLRQGFPTPYAHFGMWLVLLSFVVVLVQLIPLPPEWWSQLPGRSFQQKTLDTLGVVTAWQPLTLTPNATKAVVLSLLPAAAAYLLAITSTPAERIRFLCIILICAIIGMAVGVMQKLQGLESAFYFYGNYLDIISGTFGNRNFFAAQLYATIPFVAALATVAQEKLHLQNWLVALFALIYVGLLMVGLGGTASRAGTGLAMTAMVLAVAVVYRPKTLERSGGTKRSITFAILAAVLLISQVGMAAVLRVAKAETVDMRGQIYEVTWSAIKTYFPAGSGFGSFVPVYQMFETPRVMIEHYVNHAHNDWLELLLEGGAPAAVLITLFVLLYFASAFQLLRQEFVSSGRAVLRASAVVVLLLSLHAFVDFGLRTPALLTLFALSCGMLTLGLQAVNVSKPPVRRTARSESSITPRRPVTGFGAQVKKQGDREKAMPIKPAPPPRQ